MMCELFAMNSNQPIDVDNYLSLLMPRGGKSGPHADGWGVAYYEGLASRVFKEPSPAADSRYLRMLTKCQLKSTSVIAHLRLANPSAVGKATANTHPFEREWNGYSWVFAHNGKLPGFTHLRQYEESRFNPLGHTDSELAFCYLLEALARNIQYGEKIQPGDVLSILGPVIEELCFYGEFNFLLSNGEYLFVYAHTNLHVLEKSTDSDALQNNNVLLATNPLTNDNWKPLSPECMSIFKNGKIVETCHA